MRLGKEEKKDFKKKTLTGTPDEHYPSVFHLFAIPNGAWLSDHYTWEKKKKNQSFKWASKFEPGKQQEN